MKFPREIYVHIENDNTDTYLIADTQVDEIDKDTKKVGIYRFVEQKTFQVTKELI